MDDIAKKLVGSGAKLSQISEQAEALIDSHRQKAPTPADDALARRLLQLFDVAHSFRQKYTEEMREAYYASQNEYKPEDACKLPDEREREMYAGLFSRQLSTYMAWVLDRISQAERFFTLKATPIPSVPERYQARAVARVLQELRQLAYLPEDVALEYGRERLVDLKVAINKILFQDAQRAVVGAEKRVDDVLAEGDFRMAYMQFHHHLFRSLGVMKFPNIHIVERVRWQGDKAVVTREPVLKFKAISPFDFYWSPDSTTAQDGAYIVERTRMDYAALQWMHEKARGVIKDTTAYILDQHKTGSQWVDDHIAQVNEREAAANMSRTDAAMTLQNGSFDVLIFHLKLFGQELRAYGVDSFIGIDGKENIVDDKQYPCEAWVINGMTTYLTINAHPTGVRPYHVASYEPVAGQLYGVSAWKKIKPWEIMFRSGHRMLARAVAFESGVIAEVDSGRFANAKAPKAISPWMQYEVDADYTGGGQAAVRFLQTRANSQGLRAYLDSIEPQAQHATGIYNTMAGSTAYGTVARTRFGVESVQNNATKTIFAKAEYLDKYALEPMIQMLYTYLMLFDSDPTIKVDAQVVVSGLTSVTTREGEKQLLMQLLQYLPAMMQIDAQKGTNAVPATLIQSLFRSIVAALGGNVDGMPDPTAVSSVAQAVGLEPPGEFAQNQQALEQEMPSTQIQVPPS